MSYSEIQSKLSSIEWKLRTIISLLMFQMLCTGVIVGYVIVEILT